MSAIDMEVINKDISTELIRLMSRIGNLHVHVSGEGKVDFRGALNNSAWVGMLSTIISGDIGCMRPYDKYPTCALDNALDFLYNLECAPHLNMGGNEDHVPSTERWQTFIDGIREELTNLTEASYKKQYTYTLFKGDLVDNEVLVTVTIKPLCNEFVVGEYIAANTYNLVGEIEDFDQPKIKSCFITANGEDLEIELDKLIHYRNKKWFQPDKGDYLLHDEKSGVYVILPKEDYSFH